MHPISGRVRYYMGMDRPVPGALVSLHGAGPSSVLTDASGDFSFTGLPAGSWDVEPTMQGTLNNGVSALDASFVLQHVIGMRALTAHQQAACDATGNGTLSALDASRLLQIRVGLIPRLPVATLCGSDWVFFPTPGPVANQVVTMPQLTAGTCQRGRIAYEPLSADAPGQDFLAALFGDCTGNWTAGAGGNAAAAIVDRSGSVIRPGSWRRGRGSDARLPISVDVNQPFNALDLDIRYDARRLRATGVRATGPAGEAMVQFNARDAGVLKVALASAKPIRANGEALLLVRFENRGGALARQTAWVAAAVVDDRGVGRVR